MKKPIVFLFVLTLIFSCKTKPENQPEQQEPKEQRTGETNENSELPCLAILPEKPLDFEGQDYNFTRIDTAYFSGDDIYISYNYSGCTEGQPVLAVSESGAGKRSTVIKLSLKVKDAGLCEMLINRESCFSLSETAVVGKEFQIILNRENTYFYRP